ncbi:MaoC family dehydratase [Thalassomonas haliotis]|uniref:MaoC family dehydratase n=1 Tax=Thalassomonas haliotis TaxID=485448 RepID=A0ABY7VIV4_9GAMM|nr:MaoC family dehydratase [Thalassomonas haliotis]WDE12986.1 MaoC family dehydratase [Thalassomonas haliotis]
MPRGCFLYLLLALACGDMNFIHHDIDKAKNSRFGEIIASGSTISAHFSAMIPGHIFPISLMLGLEISFKLPAPIRANTEITMKWQVNEIQEKGDAATIVKFLVAYVCQKVTVYSTLVAGIVLPG